MMLRKSTGSRLAAGAATTVVAMAAALVLPAPAHAAGRHRAESAYDTTSSKTATATCDPGEVMVGAGGRIRDGEGGVALAAMIPTRNSVTVRGEALTGHRDAWSVVAAAICYPEPAEEYAPTIVVSPVGSRTAECPEGAGLFGTGFDLRGSELLTGLVPDPYHDSVTVRSPSLRLGDPPVAYAICIPSSVAYMNHRTSLVNGASPKRVTVPVGDDLTGAGAEITMVGSSLGSPLPISDVFIDTLMPSEDVTELSVQAVRRSSGSGASATPAGARFAGSSMAGDGDDWSVTGYGVDHDIY
jgi:hypothetical protein